MDLADAGAAFLGLQMFLCPASQSAAWHAVVQYRTILQREHLSFAFFPQSALPQTYSGLLVLTFSVLAGLLNEAEAVDDTEVLFPPGWLRISSGCVVITLPTGDLCGLLWRNLGFRGPNLRLRRTKEDRMDARRKANKNKWGNTFSFSRCQAPAAALTIPTPLIPWDSPPDSRSKTEKCFRRLQEGRPRGAGGERDSAVTRTEVDYSVKVMMHRNDVESAPGAVAGA